MYDRSAINLCGVKRPELNADLMAAAFDCAQALTLR